MAGAEAADECALSLRPKAAAAAAIFLISLRNPHSSSYTASPNNVRARTRVCVVGVIVAAAVVVAIVVVALLGSTAAAPSAAMHDLGRPFGDENEFYVIVCIYWHPVSYA